MNFPRWLLKAAVFTQLVLALPTLSSGSVCVSLDGGERAEAGVCACAGLPVSSPQATFAPAAGEVCGPCWDEAVSALRSTPPPSQGAPALISPHALASLAAFAPATAPLKPVWLGEPPGRRLPILRC